MLKASSGGKCTPHPPLLATRKIALWPVKAILFEKRAATLEADNLLSQVCASQNESDRYMYTVYVFIYIYIYTFSYSFCLEEGKGASEVPERRGGLFIEDPRRGGLPGEGGGPRGREGVCGESGGGGG